MIMENFVYTFLPARVVISGPSCCGKKVFLTNPNINLISDYDKICIYSPSLHQDLYQKLIKCFNNYTPNRKIPNLINE